MKKVSNATKKMRKIKNTKNTTLYSTLLPRITSLSHKKPAKNTNFTPTESLQAPACQPPAARLFSRSLRERISEDRRPPVNHRNPPVARLFLTESWDFPVTSQAPARDINYPAGRPPVSFTHLGYFQMPSGDRLPLPSPPAVPARALLPIFCTSLEVRLSLVTWKDDVSTHGRRL